MNSLHVAASKGDVKAVHHFIDAKIDLDVQDEVRMKNHGLLKMAIDLGLLFINL